MLLLPDSWYMKGDTGTHQFLAAVTAFMLLHVDPLRETFATHTTVERFLSRVCALVNGQMSFLGKCLVT